ncbi:YceK/YidQ family lipoprotein [Leptospira koniambonensis]|uniref:YceK/YidQ family lipoprotein n=1 Tax=Leptospira koniambonensis TaxID=2484950 RepID=A0A4R9J5B2_9LEPT|nr:YceK/YidQ family lipoprotein [Leptospira koniambonensis]TGL32805.1 YceK/YidQ family lipoprotein [Leptospira koniambonensis]
MKITNLKRKQVLQLIYIFVISFNLFNCATFHSIDSRIKEDCDIVSKQPYQVLYGGTKINIRFITADTTNDRAGYAKLAAWFGIFDFIPSFLIDTVLVPITVPWEIAGSISNSKCKITE